MNTVKSYDNLNRLTSISSTPQAPGSSPVAFNYTYNNVNQRIRVSLADGSYWNYAYDKLGQVISGHKFWADGTTVAGQEFDYAFNDIGSRTQTKSGGDQNGYCQQTANYSANNLNQYTSRGVPGSNDVVGVALAMNPVTVNGATAYRKGEYFWQPAGTNNAGKSEWVNVSVLSGGLTPSGNMFVTTNTERFGYDLDGNLTSDGRWKYTWDAENRLVSIQSYTTDPPASRRLVQWQYDGLGRRIRQTTHDLSSGDTVTEDLKFVSDGWRQVADLNYSDNSTVRSYMWGLDLSGSMDGAGGVGGLLMAYLPIPGSSYRYFYAYDGNGNVAALVKASDGTTAANYEYGPFGEAIRSSGALAKANPFRFSTKRTDNTCDLVLYEYRTYNCSSGSWLSRDPFEEDGELNLYGYIYNDAIDRADCLGLSVNDPPATVTRCCNGGKPEQPDSAGERCCSESMETITLWNSKAPIDRKHHVFPHTMLQTPRFGIIGYNNYNGESTAGPGIVKPDAKHRKDPNPMRYKACPKTVRKLEDSIANHLGGIYTFLNVWPFSDNCTSWACARLDDAGLTPPLYPQTIGITPYEMPSTY